MNDSDIEVPFRFISLIDKLTALRDVRSWMIYYVLRGSPLVSVVSFLYVRGLTNIFCWRSHLSNDDIISVFVNMCVAFCDLQAEKLLWIFEV